jgi:hypothetical protein
MRQRFADFALDIPPAEWQAEIEKWWPSSRRPGIKAE